MSVNLQFLKLGLGCLLLVLPVALLVCAGIYVLSRRIKNAGVIDVFWGFGLGALALVYAALSWPLNAKGWLVLAMALLASARLGLHLLRRFLQEHPVEDARYTAFRHAWPRHPEWMMFGVYALQGLLMVLVSAPVAWAIASSALLNAQLGILDFIACVSFIAGWGIEWLADEQLARFKRDPNNRGKTCQVGLWRYSRHPNYFGEWLMWLGYFCVALPLPYGWVTMVSPVLMYVFLTRVTGVAATEARAVLSRPDYARYQQTTSAFFLLPPKRPGAGPAKK
ncbi:MAG: DUF1295 domain-containing protein [Vampirovibrionales bacterium]|nr:DUF1295 domain-containing protein [Vampirovibrionales bacterium]